MHISVRHDIFYNFSSGVKNVENKEKKPFFVGHFHKFLRLHPLTPFDSRPKFCAKWKALQTLPNSWRCSLGSNFREVSVAIILNLFWVVFHGILPHMLSNLYKSFTSDANKVSQENEFLALRAFWFTLSWRYIFMLSFCSIAFVVAKLKISKILHTIQHPRKSPFWALTPPIWSNIAEILTRGSTVANKSTVWKMFEGS